MLGRPVYTLHQNAAVDAVIMNENAIDFIDQQIDELIAQNQKLKYQLCFNDNPDIIPIIDRVLCQEYNESDYISKCVNEAMEQIISSIEYSEGILQDDDSDYDRDSDYHYDSDGNYEDSSDDECDEFSKEKSFDKMIHLLCNHPYGIDLIEKYSNALCNHCWDKLSKNPSMIPFLMNHLDEINYSKFLDNESLEDVIEELIDDERFMSTISSLSEMNIHKICFHLACRDRKYLDLLEQRFDKLTIIKDDDQMTYELWKRICMNPDAIHLIEKYIRDTDNHFESYLYYMCENPNAMHILEKYVDQLGEEAWSNLCKYSHAIPMLQRNLQYLDEHCWETLCKNPDAIPILEQNLDRLHPRCWKYLCENPNAISILKQNLHQLDEFAWWSLCINPNAMHILQQNLDKLHADCWKTLCENPNAIPILEQNLRHLDEDCWKLLCENPNAISILKKNVHLLDDYCWYKLCNNPNAMPILEENLDRLDETCWYQLSMNPNAIHILLSFNYEQMKENMAEFREELLAYVIEPTRLDRFEDHYQIPVRKLLQFY
jgi:hypothetical protein